MRSGVPQLYCSTTKFQYQYTKFTSRINPQLYFEIDWLIRSARAYFKSTTFCALSKFRHRTVLVVVRPHPGTACRTRYWYQYYPLTRRYSYMYSCVRLSTLKYGEVKYSRTRVLVRAATRVPPLVPTTSTVPVLVLLFRISKSSKPSSISCIPNLIYRSCATRIEG